MTDNPDFVICPGCEGEFYIGDLADGELCHDCHDAAFPDDAILSGKLTDEL